MSEPSNPLPAPEDVAALVGQRRTPTWSVITTGIVLALLALLAWGLVRARAGPIDNGLAPEFS